MTDQTSHGRGARPDGLDGEDDDSTRDVLAADELDPDDIGPEDAGPDELDPDELDSQIGDAQAAIDEARRRVAEAPAEVVIVNHVMGLYELAAIHLSSDEPDLASAALAIDAVACLVDGLGDRLGAEITTLRDALNSIRLAFVQIKGRVAAP